MFIDRVLKCARAAFVQTVIKKKIRKTKYALVHRIEYE